MDQIAIRTCVSVWPARALLVACIIISNQSQAGTPSQWIEDGQLYEFECGPTELMGVYGSHAAVSIGHLTSVANGFQHEEQEGACESLLFRTPERRPRMPGGQMLCLGQTMCVLQWHLVDIWMPFPGDNYVCKSASVASMPGKLPSQDELMTM